MAFVRAGPGASRREARAQNVRSASGPRQKTLARMGHENADAEHAKQCGNDLDHHNGPLLVAQTKRQRGANSQSNSAGYRRFARH